MSTHRELKQNNLTVMSRRSHSSLHAKKGIGTDTVTRKEDECHVHETNLDLEKRPCMTFWFLGE